MVYLDNYPDLGDNVQKGEARVEGWGVLHNCLCKKASTKLLIEVVKRTPLARIGVCSGCSTQRA